MAAAVIGVRYRESWNSADNYPHGNARSNRASEVTMSPVNPAEYQRQQNGADESMARPRLPPISNFLQGVGPSTIDSQTSQPSLQHTSAHFSTSLPFVRPISNSSTVQSPWSPKDDLRQKLQFDQRPPFHIRSASDSQYDNHDYRNHTGAAFNHAVNSDSHVLHHAISMEQPFVPQPSHSTSKRVLREESIPGKGLCYIYDDGTVCQKIINGDAVNPKWGTTKAGKPRKRLGQACNTCREKKIKCDPSFPKCTQCQKFNRECKFDTTTRSHQRSPKMRSAVTSPSETYHMEDSTPYRRSSGAPTDISSHSEPALYTSPQRSYVGDDRHVLVHQALHNTIREPVTPPKRSHPSDSAVGPSPTFNKRTTERLFAEGLPPEKPYGLNQDPYVVDKNLVHTYLNAYFSHSDALKHQLVPRRLFLDWLETDQHKSSASILVIYAMLAWGCVMAKSSESTRYGSIFAEIALEGVMQPADHFDLPLIQARIVFCMHQFMVGHFERAWDLCGAALRAACALRLNTEDGIMSRCRDGPAEYGLDPIRLAESLRRTFWSIYQIDRFGVSCLGYGTPFNQANVCLRLPCLDSAFASGSVPQCPIYDGEDGIIHNINDNTNAFNKTVMRRMQVASILCDVQALASWSRLQTYANQSERVAARRRQLEQKLHNWNVEYIAHLQSDDRKSTSSDTQKFGGLHILYHHASMVLHRYIHHAHLSSTEIAHHIKSAHHHALRTLEIAQQLVSHGNKSIYDYDTAADDPTTGYAVILAIDIITAAGLNSDILENQSRLMGLILPGIDLIDRIAHSWNSAKRQQELVADRIRFLLSSASSDVANGKVAFFITKSIIASHGDENDLIYGGDRLRYLNALGVGSGLNYHSDFMKVSHP